MAKNIEFAVALAQQIIQDAHDFQEKNTDYDTYPPHISLMIRLVNGLRSLLHKKGVCVTVESNASNVSEHFAVRTADLEGLTDSYSLLENQESRELLVHLIAYRLLGKDRVRLPLNTEQFWAKREHLKSLPDYRNTIKANFNNWNLAYVDLAQLGYPIKLYYAAPGIHCLFELKQYEYHQCSPGIKATEGDVVIDAGGCWGDTALYFANEVGRAGRVFTFEFVPDNLEIMKKNLKLNPELKDRIDVVEKALWDKSEEILCCEANGPGSRVSFERSGSDDLMIHTTSIDDFVEHANVRAVNFIKMDIEGAELNALQGAIGVIRRFRPKLAISVYHRLRDFVTIPAWLASLGLNYEFYLGHYTIHSGETVLFARPRN